jgi:sporulation integral membrane protein YtvI
MLTPFVIGLIVAFIFRPLIDKIENKTHIKRSFVSIIILIIFYGLIALLLTLIGGRIFAFLQKLFYELPGLYSGTIEPALNKATSNILAQFPDIEMSLEDVFDNLSDSIYSFVSKASTIVLTTIAGFASQLPSFLINFIFTIVSSFFFTIDYHRISDFVLKQFTGERRTLILKIKTNVLGTLVKFIRAYATLITITFIELSIGFLILGIPNPILIGALVAFVDILPILGTGAILLPWVVIAFALQMNHLGIGMFILYIIITAVRQSIEPRVVGQQIGLHPVVTLLCIFVGAQLLGVIGIFLIPVLATILKKMNDEGTIHLFK